MRITRGWGVLLLGLLLPSPCWSAPLYLLCAMQGLRVGIGAACGQARTRGQLLIQSDEATCGPAALASLLRVYYGVETSEDELAQLSDTYTARTTTLLGLRDACRAKGFTATGYKMTLPQLIRTVERTGAPVLIHYQSPSLHYALVTGQVGDYVLVSDPSRGHGAVHEADFLRRWSQAVLVVQPPAPPAALPVDPAAVLRARHTSATQRLESLASATRVLGRLHR
jgi:predicted double-glycine peptidase